MRRGMVPYRFLNNYLQSKKYLQMLQNRGLSSDYVDMVNSTSSDEVKSRITETLFHAEAMPKIIVTTSYLSMGVDFKGLIKKRH